MLVISNLTISFNLQKYYTTHSFKPADLNDKNIFISENY
jgi:hypothetical protein